MVIKKVMGKMRACGSFYGLQVWQKVKCTNPNTNPFLKSNTNLTLFLTLNPNPTNNKLLARINAFYILPIETYSCDCHRWPEITQDAHSMTVMHSNSLFLLQTLFW